MKNKIKTITTLVAITIAMVWNANTAVAQLCDKSCTMTAGIDKTNCVGAANTLSGSATGPASCSNGGGSGISYSWAPTTGLSNPNIAQPTTTWSGTHNYTLTVTYTGDCCCDQPYGTKICGDDGNPCSAVVKTDVMQSHIDCTCCRMESVSGQSEKEDGGTKVYPNPSAGIFTLNLGELKPNMTISVYDIAGNNVICKNDVVDYTHQLDLTGKAKGIYFVKVTSNNEMTFFKKIVLQ